MDDEKWYLVFAIGLVLCLCLYYVINSHQNSVDKKMCLDAGMSYVQKGDHIECRSN